MDNIIEHLIQISNMHISYIVSSMMPKYSQASCISSIISGLGTLSSLGLFILGLLSYNVWREQIKREKLETIKVDLVYNLIDLVSTLKMHCYEAPCVSSKSELDSEIYIKLEESEEIYKQEIHNIDIEFTNKIRAINKSISLFDFYLEKDNDLLKSNLNKYKDNLRKFASKVLFLVMKKYSLYYKNSNNTYSREQFEKALTEIQRPAEEVETELMRLLEEIKKN